MFDLTARTALITGASGGIGAAIARTLHGAGAVVAVSGTRASALDELKTALGARAHVVACDLARAEEVERLVPAAEAALGSLDILVNNAGITRDGLALRMKDADWADVLDVNLTAAFRLARAAMRGMTRRRWGRIVNISSTAAVTGNPGQANYAASKAGLIGLTKALAHELAGRHITVNCIAPGFITTAMTEALDDKRKEMVRARVPMGRFGAPQDIAAAALYLASEEASYVTGQTLHVNGGLAMV